MNLIYFTGHRGCLLSHLVLVFHFYACTSRVQAESCLWMQFALNPVAIPAWVALADCLQNSLRFFGEEQAFCTIGAGMILHLAGTWRGKEDTSFPLSRSFFFLSPYICGGWDTYQASCWVLVGILQRWVKGGWDVGCLSLALRPVLSTPHQCS